MTYSIEKPSLADLAHFGVKGMKWGVRRGSLGSRAKGALADDTHNKTAILTRVREGRPNGLSEKIGGGVATALSGGKARRNRQYDKALGDLEARRKRLESGKLMAGDILGIIGNVSPLDLVVSIRDNRG